MSPYHEAKADFRDGLVLRTLAACHQNRRTTATKLGVSLRTLLYWLQDMRQRGVDVPGRRAA